MKSFLQFFSLTLFLLLGTGISYSQDIYFCEDVDKDGYPINDAASFTIPEDGGYLYVLVRLPYEVDCRSISLEIYRNGDYDNTVSVDTEKSWTWFWKQITFYKRGTYKFYVIDCYDDELTSGEVDIDYD